MSVESSDLPPQSDLPAPLCFVLMPFGRKTDAAGRVTNFDSVFKKIIAPAVEQAGLEPIRADEEKIGGTIHKPMFERLMLCHYAVADITGANPNVFYELGIRHALRPSSTAILFREGTVIPFDIALVRGISYKTDDAGEPLDIEAPIAAIATHLAAARHTPHDDSPIFQLVDVLPHWQIDHSKTDVFREQIDYSKRYKKRLADAVRAGADAVKEIAAEAALKNLNEIEAGIIIDLYLSLRDVESHAAMVELYDRMPPPLQRAKMIREQLGFALNRVERFDDAEAVLKEVIAEFGPSSETNGLLGRIYKDRWTKAKEAGRPEARSLLRRAIDTYLEGFEADWRDAYPGVNALTLMEQQDKPDPRKARILPVVTYSVTRKAAKNADYWDYATLLELAVLGDDRDAADENLAEAASHARHAWEIQSTKRNLGMIRAVRETRNEDGAWIKQIEDELDRAAEALKPAG
jgi:cell division septum initiation protein DivIVA